MSKSDDELSYSKSDSKKLSGYAAALLVAALLLSLWGANSTGLVVSSAKPQKAEGSVELPALPIPDDAKGRERLLEQGKQLSSQYCAGCHADNSKLVGPSFTEIVASYSAGGAGNMHGLSATIHPNSWERSRPAGGSDLSDRFSDYESGPSMTLSEQDRNAIALWMSQSFKARGD